MTDYDALGDREIDALVAGKVMGWTQVTEHSVHGMWTGIPPGKVGFNYILPFCSDDNAVRLVRNQIAELGMNAIRAYQSELAQLVWPNGTPSTLLKGADHFAFSLQHAPARLQMIAALKAKEGSNG